MFSLVGILGLAAFMTGINCSPDDQFPSHLDSRLPSTRFTSGSGSPNLIDFDLVGRVLSSRLNNILKKAGKQQQQQHLDQDRELGSKPFNKRLSGIASGVELGPDLLIQQDLGSMRPRSSLSDELDDSDSHLSTLGLLPGARHSDELPLSHLDMIRRLSSEMNTLPLSSPGPLSLRSDDSFGVHSQFPRNSMIDDALDNRFAMPMSNSESSNGAFGQFLDFDSTRTPEDSDSSNDIFGQFLDFDLDHRSPINSDLDSLSSSDMGPDNPLLQSPHRFSQPLPRFRLDSNLISPSSEALSSSSVGDRSLFEGRMAGLQSDNFDFPEFQDIDDVSSIQSRSLDLSGISPFSRSDRRLDFSYLPSTSFPSRSRSLRDAPNSFNMGILGHSSVIPAPRTGWRVSSAMDNTHLDGLGRELFDFSSGLSGTASPYSPYRSLGGTSYLDYIPSRERRAYDPSRWYEYNRRLRMPYDTYPRMRRFSRSIPRTSSFRRLGGSYPNPIVRNKITF